MTAIDVERLQEVLAAVDADGSLSSVGAALAAIRRALGVPARCGDRVRLPLSDIVGDVTFQCDLHASHYGPHGQTLSTGPGSETGAHARLGWSWLSAGVVVAFDDDDAGVQGPPAPPVEWEYAEREVGRKHGSPGPPDGPGWVRDPHRGRPGEGFERFDAHDEYYWRRPVLCGTCHHPNAAHHHEMPMGNDDGSAGRRWWQCTAGGAVGRLCSCAQPVTDEQMEAR